MTIRDVIKEYAKPTFYVGLNIKMQGFYKDNLITLTMDAPISREIDPTKENITLIEKNIAYGYLNITDKDGNVLFSIISNNQPTFVKYTPPVSDITKTLTDDEKLIAKNMIKGSVGTVTGKIIGSTNIPILIEAKRLESQNSKTKRKTVIAAIDNRIAQIQEIVHKAQMEGIK